MTKKVINQTINATQTTIATITATETTERTPAYYMPINKKADFGSEEFYKAEGVTVRTMDKFGKKRAYAILPIEGYDEATDEEKIELMDKANAFTQAIDNKRRTDARAIGRVTEHEKMSLNRLFESGYDPTLDKIDVAIKISHTLVQGDKDVSDNIISNSYAVSQTETTEKKEPATSNVFLEEELDDFDYAGKKSVSRGRYDSFSDLENPEYIVAKTILYAKLHAMVDELDGEDLEIATAIMEGVSERKLAEKLNVPLATLQRHRVKLMARFKDILGEDNNF